MQSPCEELRRTAMNAARDKQMLTKAETLIEALPYFQRYAG